MLLDPETLALAPGVERLLPRDGLKTELFPCLVETNTPICETAFEAGDELRRLRRLVVELAASEGLAVAAAGSHPFSIPEEQQIVQEPRYRKMVDELGGDREGTTRLRPPRPRRDGELRRVPPHARGASALAAGRARGLGELAVPRRRGPARSRRGSPGCGGFPGAARRRGWERWRTGRPRSRRRASTTRGSGGTHDPTRGSGRSRCGSPTRRRRSTARPRSSLWCRRSARRHRSRRSTSSTRSSRRRAGSAHGVVATLREPAEALRQLDIGRREGLEAVAADLVKRSRP